MSNPDFPQEGDAALVAKGRPGDNREPMSVSELGAALKRAVEDRFGFVRVRGELSGLKRAGSGHLYACLKDDAAVLDAVMWRSVAERLPFRPEDGLEVIATGRITTYPGRSKYQIIIERMELAGEGALLALLERNRQRFAAEGLFTNARPLPFAPKVIGVVTSPTGAVIRDILHRLEDRFPVKVLVWPVLVQGAGAAEQVAAAVRGFSALAPGGPVPRPELVIVARGGGSIEDLWAFNEEAVVRAIHASSIPVISAVGHETDTTLADHAADLRAPTPTAAAELAVPVRRELAALLGELALRKRRAIGRPLSLGRERLAFRVSRLPRRESLLASPAQRLDEAGERLRRALQARAGLGRERLARLRLAPQLIERALRDARTRLDRAGLAPHLAERRLSEAGLRLAQAGLSPHLVERGLREAQARLARAGLVPALLQRPLRGRQDRLAALHRLLGQLHPERPLARGYAMVLDTQGQAVTRAGDAARAPALTIRFADGAVPVVPGAAARRPGRRPGEAGDEAGQPKLL